MPDLIFPDSSFPDPREQVSRGVLTNCYVETNGDEKKWIRAPGLKQFGTATLGEFRGFIVVGTVMYVVFGSTVYKYFASGGDGLPLSGELPGEGPVTMARNNAAIPDIVIVSAGDGAFIISGDAVLSYPSENIGSPNSVSNAKGYFIFTYGNGLMRSSELNSLDIPDNNFANAESRPDGLLRGIQLPDGTLLVAGQTSMEVWGGLSETNFPFVYMTAVQRGLIGPYAIAGHGDGFGHGVYFVSDDNSTYRFGASPQRISPPGLDRLIEETINKASIEVMCFVSRGHPFVAVQGPGWTYVFDVATEKWHKRESHLQSRWRATQAVKFGDRWITGDTLSPTLSIIDGAEMFELGQPLAMTIETGPQKKFPAQFRISRLHVYASTGVGIVTGTDPIQTDPIMEVWVHNGKKWSEKPWRKPLGQQKTFQKITINEMGHTTGHGARFRFRVSDPVDVAFMSNSTIDVLELAA